MTHLIKRYEVNPMSMGLMVAKDLREEFQRAMKQFLLHAIIVMVEESPHFQIHLEGNQDKDSLWEHNVRGAGLDVLAGLTSGAWVPLPVGLAWTLPNGTDKIQFLPYGPEELLVSDLYPILDANDELLHVGQSNEAMLYSNDYWHGSVLTQQNLPVLLSEATHALVLSNGSYVKGSNFRAHRSLLMKFLTEDLQQVSDVVE